MLSWCAKSPSTIEMMTMGRERERGQRARERGAARRCQIPKSPTPSPKNSSDYDVFLHIQGAAARCQMRLVSFRDSCAPTLQRVPQEPTCFCSVAGATECGLSCAPWLALLRSHRCVFRSRSIFSAVLDSRLAGFAPSAPTVFASAHAQISPLGQNGLSPHPDFHFLGSR